MLFRRLSGRGSIPTSRIARRVLPTCNRCARRLTSWAASLRRTWTQTQNECSSGSSGPGRRRLGPRSEVLNGIGHFEGRSSLKTWIFRILLNKANTRAAREAGSIPFSALGGGDFDADEPSVDVDRFLGPESEWAGHWASTPQRFEDLPEERLLAG